MAQHAPSSGDKVTSQGSSGDKVTLVAEGAEVAAMALCDLARSREMQTTISEEGAIGHLVAMLASVEAGGRPAESARSWAAAALGALAQGHSLNQTLVAVEGGLAPLVALLRPSMPPACTQHATRALTALAADLENQLAIGAVSGAFEHLVGMLSASSAALQADGVTALAALCRDCMPNQRACLETGAIAPLVRLLGAPVETCRKHASAVLGMLCEGAHASHRRALLSAVVGATGRVPYGEHAPLAAIQTLASIAARSDAELEALAQLDETLPALIGLLGHDHIHTREAEEAAQLLAVLSRRPERRDACVLAGAVAPLAHMLGSALGSARAAAVGSLASLASSLRVCAALEAHHGALSHLVNVLGEAADPADDPWAVAQALQVRTQAARLLGLLHACAHHGALSPHRCARRLRGCWAS